MDILYITTETKQQMLKYCEQELIDFVFDDFIEQGGKIITKEDNQLPSRWWIITDYINSTSIEKMQKLAVVLSFSAVAVVIQIEYYKSYGDVAILQLLTNLNIINEKESEIFTKFFYNIRQGNKCKFSI